MHNGRQHAQQGARIAAADAEAAADEKEVSTAIVCDDAAGARRRKDRAGVDRPQIQVACEAEGTSARQHETIPSLQANRLSNSLNREPTGAGNHGVAFDQPVLVWELDGPVTACIESG